ncbi:MAG: SDR family NAD(P)-dependent oxidoreductase [Sandaracinaceae bacterium]|nr:SDR family NAD(P)-dependent oxidoreductase [Sandaracinaceae bacterium]
MHVLLTGASSGIGEGMARVFAEAGWDLTLVARRRAELERVAASIEGRVRVNVVAADVAALDALDALVGAAEAELGPIDVLVNNAGVQIVAPTASVDPADGERLVTVNLLAPFRLTHAALARMIPRGRGTIVDISSLSALAPTPGMYHYSASKAALAAASESLRAEVRPRGVHVVTVYPGPIETPMARRAIDAYPEDPTRGLPVGDARTLAVRIRRAIERRHDRVIYPRAYGIARMFPGTTRWVMDHFSPTPRALPPAAG